MYVTSYHDKYSYYEYKELWYVIWIVFIDTHHYTQLSYKVPLFQIQCAMLDSEYCSNYCEVKISKKIQCLFNLFFACTFKLV